MAGRKRGPKELAARDWVFGSRPRRLLLEAAIRRTPPPGGWTKTDLAAIAGVSRHGGVDEHVEKLAALGLLVPDGRKLSRPSKRPDLAEPLARLLDLLEGYPDDRPLGG